MNKPEIFFLGHIHDIDGFNLLNEYVDAFSDFKSVIITYPQQRTDIANCLSKINKFTSISSPNKGRDMFPFWLALQKIETPEEAIIIKWHDKKRNHFSQSALEIDERRNLLKFCIPYQDFYPPLVLPLIETEKFSASTIDGWLLPLALRLGANGNSLHQFALDQGWNWDHIYNNAHFPAGGIFAVRAEIIRKSAWFKQINSEIEYGFGGLDGTWAHASERWLGVLMSAFGAIAEVK